MRRKGGFVLLGVVLFIGFTAGSIIGFIYWLTHFKIHLYQVIIEEYHYNRIQEIPLATISSDFDGENFVEKVNKVYYGFYSQGEVDSFRSKVKDIVIKQVGEGYGWSLVISNLYFGTERGEECRIVSDQVYDSSKRCICSSECPGHPNEPLGVASIYDECEEVFADKLPYCLGSLTINITFFNDTFPFPLVFNGSDKFIARMVFNAYA